MNRVILVATWLDRRRRLRHCAHSSLAPIYGDAINHCGGWRLQCRDCGRFVDGPVQLAEFRSHEREITT